MTGLKMEREMATFKGWAKDTDPRYQEGYTVVTGYIRTYL